MGDDRHGLGVGAGRRIMGAQIRAQLRQAAEKANQEADRTEAEGSRFAWKAIASPGRSLSSLGLPLSPMSVFALGFSPPLYMMVRACMPVVRVNIVGPLRDTILSACIATCPSGKSVPFSAVR